MADSATQGAQAEEPKLGFVLLTDIAGSQPQAEGYPAEYEEAEAQHDAIIKEVAAKHGGRRDLSTGDGFYAVFGTARSAVMAAVEMQSRIAAEVKALPDESHLRVRCLLHAGLLGHKPEDDRPTGNVFRELARMAAKDGLRVNGGQIVVTGQVQRHLAYAPPPDCALRHLGTYDVARLPLPYDIYQVDCARLPTEEFKPLHSRRPTNLPYDTTEFFGRESELADLRKPVLGEHRRLISLVEHGGYGKSRLAIEFGWRSLAFFDDGAWLIELKDLELPAECSATEAAEAIAAKSLEKLRLQRDPQIKTAAEQLIGRWRAEHVLLIFDNFEHVELGASVLPTLLHECGRMQIVVTSRHELGLANEGERIIHIGPLDESAKLFADRAPHGSVDLERDRAQIESICDALHNLPLAVTVAAAWADRFTLSELKDKLPKIIARDQVIAASNEWSWKLLTDQQRERLARLSFFSGGGRLDDIAAVFGESDELAAAEQLAELRARNWLTLSSQDSPRRYDFDNPLLQEFCSAKMSAEFGGIQVEAQLKHVEHFADVSRAWTEALHGGSAGSQMQAVDRFAMDKPNFDLSYRISVNAKLIRPFSHLRYGYCAYSGVWDFSVAREYYEQALVLHSELGDKQGEANDLHSLGEIARRVDDYPEASDYYERARVLYLGTEDKLGGGNCHYGLGFIAYVQGDHVEAKKRFQEALLLHREIGDELGQANDLAALGEVAILEGDFSAAFICYEQALVLHRGLGNRLGEATALKGLGHAARQQGHYGVSREQYEQALTLYRELRIVIGEANVLNGLGHVACLQSDCDAARACYEQALSLDRMMGNKLGEANNLQGLGDVAQMEGDHAAARTHYKSALSLHRVSGAKQAQANDLFGLGMSSLQEGRWAEGRQELSDALILYEVIGLENLVQWIRQLLNTLPE